MNYEKTNQRTNAYHQQDDWDEVHNQLLAVQEKSMQVSNPGDADEEEADQVARKVVNGQSASINGSSNSLNRKGEGEAEVSPEFQSQLQNNIGGGNSLDNSTRQEMESKMGADFSGVKIHTGNEADNMNKNINAKAFTHGSDVFFRNGEFDTGSKAGKELLAHELVHTVQQGKGLARKIQRRMLSKEAVADKKYKTEDKVDDYYIVLPADVKAQVNVTITKWYEGIKTGLITSMPNTKIDDYLAFKDEKSALAKGAEILDGMAAAKQAVWKAPDDNPRGGRVKSVADFDFKFDNLKNIDNSVIYRLSEIQNMFFANTGIFARYNSSEDAAHSKEGFDMKTDKVTPVPISTGKKAPPGDRAFKANADVKASELIDELRGKRSTRTEKEEAEGKNYDVDQRILIDCRTMISLVQYMSLRDVMNTGVAADQKDVAFNKKFENDPMVIAPIAQPLKGASSPMDDNYDLVEILSLDQLVVGDVVNFTNKQDYNDFVRFNNGLLWSSEWSMFSGMKKGKYMFEGFGAAEKSYEVMLDTMLLRYKDGYDSVKNNEDFKYANGNKKYDLNHRTAPDDFIQTMDHQTPGLMNMVYRPNVNRMMQQ